MLEGLLKLREGLVRDLSAVDALIAQAREVPDAAPSWKRPNGRLSDAGVAELETDFRSGILTDAEISRKFGLTAGGISTRRRLFEATQVEEGDER